MTKKTRFDMDHGTRQPDRKGTCELKETRAPLHQLLPQDCL